MNKAIVKADERQNILVVAALARELAPLRNRDLDDVTLLRLGVGRKNAGRRLRGWFDRYRVDAVICLGFAGALSPILGIADLVIDRSGWPMAKPLHQPSSAPIHFGKIITLDEMIGALGKRELAATLDNREIACVDMESAAVAQVCRERGIPYLLLRAISDLFAEDFPVDFNQCRDRDGEISTTKVMKAVFRRPQALKPLMELNRRTELCAKRLAEFVEQTLPQLREELAR